MHHVKRTPYICRQCRHNAYFAHKKVTVWRDYSTILSDERAIRVAIIGSGPAGFYSAYRLLKKLPDAKIDMYERLPVPYGLVRYGVAPDHPEVKKCSETLIDVAKNPNFNFVGNVSIGNREKELPLTALTPHYDALLFAYGASKDRKLGIPGEDLNGVISARAFVGWYNGLPEHADLNPNLTAGDTAVVIGQGNVALDVTRILLSPLNDLRKTDIAEEAVETLAKSKIRDVKVIGRRGPLQAPYTIKELREIMNLPQVGFKPPPESWSDLIQVDRKRLPRQLRRIAELLDKGSNTSLESSEKAWQLGFLRAPAAFLSSDNINLEAVGFEQAKYAQRISDLITGDAQTDFSAIRSLQVTPTGQKSMVHASLAFRSVGYQSRPLNGMEEIGVLFDQNRCIIPNDRWGRVMSPNHNLGGEPTTGHVPGMYCAGWVKRGPTGVIASTLDDAFTTADVIAKDWAEGKEFIKDSDGRGWEAVRKLLESREIRSVSWKDWEKIDEEERRRGRQKGKGEGENKKI